MKICVSKNALSLVLGTFLLSGVANATTIIGSTFDPGSGADGWSAVVCENPGCPLGAESMTTLSFGSDKFGHDLDDPQPFEPAGPGHLFMVDPGSDETGMYEAPAAFGDALSTPGAILEIDIFVDSGDDGSYDTGDTAGMVPLFYLQNLSLPTPGAVVYLLDVADIGLDTWHSFDIPITPSGGPGKWFAFGFGLPGPSEDTSGTALAATLGAGPGETIFRIWGELTNDSADLDGTSLDNVRITVVPVPAALPMMLSALAAFGIWRRRAV